MTKQRLWRAAFFVTITAALCAGLAVPAMQGTPVQAAPHAANALDVVINELAWSGTDAASADEWIELYNPTPSAITLTGWRLTDNGNIDVALSGSIPAGGYYLLERTDNNTISNITADLIYSGALDNAGEALYLYDDIGNLIDSVNSNGGAWPMNVASYLPNASLERVNSLFPDSDSNWSANNGAIINGVDQSSNPIKGTPKQINSVTLDLTATVTPTATGTATETGTPTNTGTVTSTGTVTNTPTATATGGPVQLVLINEVAWSGTVANSDDEWIELHNPTSSPINITGWQLYGDDNTLNKVGDPSITLSGTIPADSYFLLERVEQAVNDVTANQIYSTGGLVNSGERLYLKDSSGRVIDTANLDGGAWPAGTASPGYASMERVGTTNQWVTYAGVVPIAHDRNGNPIRGTPGRGNWISTTSITTITADSPDPSLVNQNVTVTVSVIGGETIPTGTVSITGTNSNCTITLANGSGSCVVRFTSTGAKTIAATYSGDNSHPASSDTESHQVSFTVLTPTPTRRPTPLPPPPLIGINEFVPRPGHDWNLDGVINVGDEYIELINHGVIDVNLSGYTLDDEVNIGSTPYRLPSITLKPGERRVFYSSETGLLLSDGGDGVRLLKPNGQLGDAINYAVVRFPDQSYCRLPDNGGLDDWNQNCFPTPGLRNSLSASTVNPPTSGDAENLCPIADTLPPDFVAAECQPFGNNIWNPAYWDRFGWYGERSLPESPGKWPVFVD